MTKSQSISPLRQRMLDDMRMRTLKPSTQAGYLRAVVRLTRFLKDAGVTAATLNNLITGLKFFYGTTLGTPKVMTLMSPLREPERLPAVLSPEEVAELIACAPNLKAQTALSVAYGAGLRSSEVVRLKTTDIDSDRMVIRIEQGKGAKDRTAMLSPALLQQLRTWYRHARSKQQVRPGSWLFRGQGGKHLSARQLNRLFHQAVDAAGIERRVSLHSLRHSFATETTARYSHVASKTLLKVQGPLDRLPLRASDPRHTEVIGP
jgi:site-specific recombinase XerD